MIRASSLRQAQLCPGSVRAQDGLPEIATDDSALGTLIHAADAGNAGALAQLREIPGGIDLLEKTVVKREELSAEYARGGDVYALLREETLTGLLVTGHPDQVIILEMKDGAFRALIWDSKTGWKEQDEPAINLQLRAYAYLVFTRYPTVEEIVAGLIPSRFKVPSPVVYTRADITAIEAELKDIQAEAAKPEAKRIPSFDACRYCRAKATDRCPETLQLPATFNQPLNIATLTPEQKGILLEQCEMASDRIKTIREKLKEELAGNPDAIAGWTLKPGRKNPIIAKPSEIYALVEDAIDPEAFGDSCCEVSVTKLRKVLGAALDWKVKDHKKNTDARLGALLTYVETAPSLARTKQQEQLEEAA